MNHDTGNPEMIRVYTITLTVLRSPLRLLQEIGEEFGDAILGSSIEGPFEVAASNYEHRT